MSDETGKQAHPLFLPENEDDDVIGNEDIGCISIQRTAPYQENAGRTYTADELPDPDAIRQKFGGGSYKVQARDVMRRVTKGGTRYYQFKGDPYPMDGTGPVAKKEKEAAPPLQPQIIQQPAPAMDLTPLVQMIGQQTSVLVKLIEGQQSFTERIVTALANRPAESSSGGDVDTLIRGMELGVAQLQNVIDARETARAETAAGGGDDIASTVQAITGAVSTFAEMKGKGKPPPKGNGSPPPKAVT